MKSILKRSRIALAALLAVAIHAGANAATPVSPLLTNSTAWDCVLSGKDSEQGVMFLTFDGDGYGNGTFIGAMANARVKNPKKPDNDRSPIGTDRNPTNSSPTVTSNLFGYINIVGNWAYDYKGYVVGSFNHLVATGGSSGTNVVTNMFSFKAKIASNRTLTASYSTTLGGTGTFKGVPMKTVTNVAGIAGSWTGTEVADKVTFYEWFSLTPASMLWPNLYEVAGYGPAYDLEGFLLASCQKKIAIGNARINGSSGSGRASVGPLSNKKTVFGGKMKGLSSLSTNLISYEAFHVVP